MNIINQILATDLALLVWARTLVPADYAQIVQFSGESIVAFGAVFLLCLWLFGVYKNDNQYKKNAVLIFLTIILVFGLYALINLGIPQWRPGAMEIPGAIRPLIPHPIDNSFPSGHALFTGALLVGLFRYFRLGWLIGITILIGMLTLGARVLGGVHYPGDIIGGLLVGTLGAFFLRPITEYLALHITPILIKIARWIKL